MIFFENGGIGATICIHPTKIIVVIFLALHKKRQLTLLIDYKLTVAIYHGVLHKVKLLLAHVRICSLHVCRIQSDCCQIEQALLRIVLSDTRLISARQKRLLHCGLWIHCLSGEVGSHLVKLVLSFFLLLAVRLPRVGVS